jgi:hypothetical protein
MLPARLRFQVPQVLVRFPKHPDGEREFEIGVSNGDVLVEYALYSFLGPRAILGIGLVACNLLL